MPPPTIHAVPPRLVIHKSRDRHHQPSQNGRRIVQSYSMRNSQSQDRLVKWLEESSEPSVEEGAAPICRNNVQRYSHNGWRSRSHDSVYIMSRVRDQPPVGSSDRSGTGYKLDERGPHDQQLNGSCDNVFQSHDGRGQRSRHGTSLDRTRSKSYDDRLHESERSKSLDRQKGADGGFELKGTQVMLNDLNRTISAPSLNPQKWNRPMGQEPLSPSKSDQHIEACYKGSAMHPTIPPREAPRNSRRKKRVIPNNYADPVDGIVVAGSQLGQLAVYDEMERPDSVIVPATSIPGVLEQGRAPRRRVVLHTATILEDDERTSERRRSHHANGMPILVNMDKNGQDSDSESTEDIHAKTKFPPKKLPLLSRFRQWQKEQWKKMKRIRKTRLEKLIPPEPMTDTAVAAVDEGSVDTLHYTVTSPDANADEEFLMYRVRFQGELAYEEATQQSHKRGKKELKKISSKITPVVRSSTFILSDIDKRRTKEAEADNHRVQCFEKGPNDFTDSALERDASMVLSQGNGFQPLSRKSTYVLSDLEQPIC